MMSRFAEQLARGQIIPLNPQQLRDKMHEAGINMRYLGVLKSLLPSTKQGQISLLLVSIITRCLKNFIRSAIRAATPQDLSNTIVQ